MRDGEEGGCDPSTTGIKRGARSGFGALRCYVCHRCTAASAGIDAATVSHLLLRTLHVHTINSCLCMR